jgi:cysteine desulfurase
LKHLHFHTDAVQSIGKTPLDVKRFGVDLVSLSGHKLHGPKGVGALYLRKGVRISKLIYGGHHERDRRAGTENVPAIVGLGRAAEMAHSGMQEQAARIAALRDRLEREAIARLPGVTVNGSAEHRLPNISNLSFPGVDGESLLIALDLKGIAVSTGSACASGSLEPSHVLQALGLARERVRGSLRFSLSRYNTAEDIDYAVDSLEEVVSRLRAMSPDGEIADQDAALRAESSL